MEQKLLKRGILLNEDGTLTEAGYAFSRVKSYNRKNIKRHNRIKRKEWNYFAFLNKENGVAITVSNLTYAALLSFTYFDFEKNLYLTKTITKFFPKQNKYKIEPNSYDTYIKTKKALFHVSTINDETTIYVDIQNFADKKQLIMNIGVRKTSDKSIVTAIPFAKKGNFYYNEKINLLKAEGNIQIGNKSKPIKESYGVLDWGRGVWPYRTTWYWSSCNIKDENNNLIGFNLGYGLGDNSNGTENALFVNNEVFKLNDVKFLFAKNLKGNIDYSKDVELLSESGDIKLKFEPSFDRHDHINAGIIESNQNQLFGYFTGTIVANNHEYKFDHVIGFLEKVINKY